jgi:molybdate-binding protein/DNA-binding XRE family transcriptional regulator
LTRLARGQSQGDLARSAGVTRQAISGIESGRWSPSLDVALAVARSLDSSVEELFGSPAEAPPVRGRLAVRGPWPSAQSSTRLLLADVAGDTVAFPLGGDRALTPGFQPALGIAPPLEYAPDVAGAALDHGRPLGSIDARRIAGASPTVALAGCDPALALLAGPLLRHDPAVGFAWWPCGNGAAADLLESGSVHAAALHRRSDTRARQRPGIEVVGFASWREGLAVSPRYHGRVNDLRDVAKLGLRVANREEGSEARRLLDDELARLHLDPSSIVGYQTEVTAHLLVTSSIAAGLADVGVSTEPAALTYGLEFIPWQQDLSELHIRRALVGSVEVQALFDVLAGRELPAQLAALAGYDAEPCGRILAA